MVECMLFQVWDIGFDVQNHIYPKTNNKKSERSETNNTKC